MRVVLASNALGLGGTEKGLETHALAFDRERVDVAVVAMKSGGERVAKLEAAGIEVVQAGGDRARIAAALEGADVVHVFRGGVAEGLLPAARREAGVPAMVETNVFGAVDASADAPEFSCHLVPSEFCALRLRRRLGLSTTELNRRYRVSYWPVDVARLRALAPDPAEAKRSLGLDPDRPVVGRLGRDNDRKWRNLIVDMIPPLLELEPDAQVVLVGPTPAKLRRLDRLGVLDRVHLVRPTADEGELAALYAACDVFVTAAEIGESHSYAIEEAMALGIPVVTCSTPWVDNAQIEQVDEGVTGHVADHPAPFAEAVASLVADPAKRSRFQEAARAKADARYGAAILTRQLERLYGSLLEAGEPPAEWMPALEEVDGFEAEYERRLRDRFRPSTDGERRAERREWALERAGWAARAARTSMSPEGLGYVYWAARSKLGGGAT